MKLSKLPLGSHSGPRFGFHLTSNRHNNVMYVFYAGVTWGHVPLLMGVFIGNSLRGRQSGSSLWAAINQSALTENLFVY